MFPFTKVGFLLRKCCKKCCCYNYSRNLVAVLFLFTDISGIILPPSQIKVHFAVDLLSLTYAFPFPGYQMGPIMQKGPG